MTTTASVGVDPDAKEVRTTTLCVFIAAAMYIIIWYVCVYHRLFVLHYLAIKHGKDVQLTYPVSSAKKR